MMNDETTKEATGFFDNPIAMCALIRFKPFEYQKKFLNACTFKSRIVSVWCRQIGKSTCLAIYCIWHAMVNPKAQILIISPTQRQSNELFGKIRDFLFSHDALKDNISFIRAEDCTFENGSRIISLPTGAYGTGIRGFTASVIVLEESGEIKDEIVNEVILPMGAAQPNLKIIQIGTPKGKNHFYDASTSELYENFHYSYKEALKVGLFTPEYVDEVRSGCSELQFETEYGAKFMEDSDAYFRLELIQSCIEDYELLDLSVF